MLKFRLYKTDGIEAGEAVYALTIKPGEVIRTSGNRKLRVVDVVPTEDDSEEYAGLLMVEAA